MKVEIKLPESKSRSYNVFIDELDNIEIDTKVAIVTNPTVSALHLEDFKSRIKAKELFVISVPDGEEYKSLDTVEEILNECFEKRLDRKSVLIAFGGGVIGDMTGFCASIYQRGIEFIQVPTTLLSQVDASVGGKTGVNTKYGKNLIGAFWQPRAVYCETRFLDTLPSREFSAGVAEIIKMAVTFDKDFFEWLYDNDIKKRDNLKVAIKKSVETKAKVVSMDEKEAGIRAVLNYGHTFGHVIENLTRYKKFLHGEAVAIGMVMANELAVELGLMREDEAKRVKELLERYSLPVWYEIEDKEAFYELFFLDKKSFNNRLKFILPKGLGGYEMRDDIDKDTLFRVLERFS